MSETTPGDPPGAVLSADSRPFCVNHPRARSVYRCEVCVSAICATCAFTFHGNTHYCPACATAPRDPLSPSRKRRVNASLGLGALATVSAVISFALVAGSDLDEKQTAVLGGVFWLLCFIPAVVGMILALASIEKRAPNTGRLWTGALWNGLIVGLFVLLMIAAALNGND